MYLNRINLINSTLIFIVILLILLPLSLPLGSVGDKPIDLTYSDIFLFLSILYFLCIGRFHVSNNEKKIIIMSCFTFLFIIFLGIIGTIIEGGNIVPLLSSLRFSKHILFVLPALVLYKVYQPSSVQLSRCAGFVSILIVMVLFLSDIFFNSQFPSSRWGGFVFNMETYGFPNSVVVFYSFYICFILNLLLMDKKILLIPFLLIMIAIVFFAFSRSGWIATLIVLIFTLFYGSLQSKKITFFNIVLLFLFAVVFSIFFNTLYPIIEPWMYKIDTITGKDITVSGRDLIWADALNLISEKPIFGYLFFPFSNYVAGYDTPHQQYLEILYKMGMVGFLVYFSYLFYLFIVFVKEGLKGTLFSKHVVVIFTFLTIAILITNFAQPNLSFSLLGNAYIFFLSLYYFIFLNEAN